MIDPAIRRRGIGGSEIAAVLGVDEWRDGFSVWAEKRGELTRMPPSFDMRMGKAVERAIIDCYQYLTGRKVEFVDETFQDAQRPFIVYTPDALCVHERRGVDAKWVKVRQRSKWGATGDEIPAAYACQAHWYMAAMDYPLWDIVALFSDGHPQVYTLERDVELQAEMVARAEEFWRRYILGDEQPPIGWSDDARRWVHNRFPRNIDDLRPATPEETELLEMYARTRDEEEVLTDTRERLETELKQAIGTADGITWPRGRLTWKLTKDSEPVNWKKLGQSLLKNYATDERKALEREFTDTKAGVRRLLLKYDDQQAEKAHAR